MLKRVLVAVAALMVSVSLRVSAAPLGLGDAAPKVEVKEFVKGEPVKEFKKGQIYVVEFWATWCGPCRISIPHLTEMAKKHKDITFIGVSVFERDSSLVKPFVAKMGDKMDYHVAMDDVPMGGPGQSGKMAQNWMEAARQEGIPTAFVIDKDTKIAWIGHPMEMDKPLDQIEAGKWDLKVAQAEQDKKLALQQKLQELNAKFQQAGSDMAKQMTVVDDAIHSDPDLETVIGMTKMQLLLGPKGDANKAASYVAHLSETVYKDDGAALNQLAWPLVDPAQPKRSPQMLKAALKVALRADQLQKGKDAATADTLARAYFCNGNVAKAVATETRAVQLAKGTELEKDASLANSLAEYRKAQQK
jgi:thiol-disulfide isomerase/thioredoxin